MLARLARPAFLWAGVVGPALFVAFGASGSGPSGELLLPASAGLVQRIALVTGLGWVLLLAVHEISIAAHAGHRRADLVG